MTEKLEKMLADEFRDGSYDLPVDAEQLTVTLRRRRSRRTTATMATSVAGVAVAVAVGAGAVNLVGSGSPPPTGPAASATATAVARQIAADSVQLGEVVVRGLPAGSRLAADPGAVLARPPVGELPKTGDRAVITVPAAGGEIRLVVVVGAEDGAGLPGITPEDQSWLSSLGGAHALVTVENETETTYLNANTPTGRRWHLVATGPDAAARLAVIRSVATATVPGT